MDCVAVEDFDGFHSPNDYEVERIYPYIQKTTVRELRPINVWIVICYLFFVFVLVDTTTILLGGKVGRTLVEIPLLVILAVILVNLSRAKKNKQYREYCFSVRAFYVLNCRIFETKFDTELNSEAEVKVCTDTQYCDKKFLIDIDTARINKAEVMLVYCAGEYMLLSEKRLNA